MSVLTGIQFPLFGMVSKAITGGEDRKLKSFEQIAAGFVGGAFSGFACAPMELVLIQQQKFGGSLFATPMALAKTHGISSLYRGFITSSGREGIFTAGYVIEIRSKFSGEIQRLLQVHGPGAFNYLIHAGNAWPLSSQRESCGCSCWRYNCRHLVTSA